MKTNPQVVVKIDSEAACKCLQVCGERLAVSFWERQVGGPGLAGWRQKPSGLGSPTGPPPAAPRCLSHDCGPRILYPSNATMENLDSSDCDGERASE